MKAIKFSLKMKKIERCQYASKRYGNPFIESEPSEEEKTESINMFANDLEIFLKKKKTRSVNTLPNDIEIFLEELFLETSELKKLYPFAKV